MAWELANKNKVPTFKYFINWQDITTDFLVPVSESIESLSSNKNFTHVSCTEYTDTGLWLIGVIKDPNYEMFDYYDGNSQSLIDDLNTIYPLNQYTYYLFTSGWEYGDIFVDCGDYIK